MSIPDEQRIGTLVADKFRIEHLIDHRTSCALFLATDGWTGGRVILHIVRAEFTTPDQDAVRGLLDDARGASSIGHPNIASIAELGFDAEGSVFMALEAMSGETLAGLLGRVAGGALGSVHGVDLLLPVVGAMGAAHSQSLVHGDIRPENVFVTYDAVGHPTAKLFGFGLSRVQDSAARRAGPGQIAGNPFYMSPEEAMGEPAGAASDVWAMGVVLYQAISGRLPFDAEDAGTMLRQITKTAARPLAHVAPQTPPAVAQAIDRALIADRAVR